jgi:hypothetical protein
MDIETAIARTMDDWDSTQFIWGSDDCVLSVCPYVEMLTGKDPSADYDFNYWTPDGAYRFIKKHGGFRSLARTAMHSAGAISVQRKQGEGTLLWCRKANTSPRASIWAT